MRLRHERLAESSVITENIIGKVELDAITGLKF